MLGQDINDFHLKIQIEGHSCPLNIEENDIVGNFFDLPVKGQQILSQNCQAVTSPKSNERICFSNLTTKKYLKLEF